MSIVRKHQNFLYMLRKAFETNAIFFVCRRTHAQHEHGFTFLEAIKVHMTRMPSFYKQKMLRHAQMQMLVSKVFQKTAVPFFTNANGTQNFFSIKIFFFQKMGASALRLRGPSGPTPIFWEKRFVEKNICVPFAFVKNGTGAF